MLKALGLAAALALGVSGLRADALPTGQDVVTLKDGRVLHCEVVEEDSTSLVVLVGGVQHRYSRARVRRVVYGSDPISPEPVAGSPDADLRPAPPPGTYPDTAPKGDLVADLATRYRVPVGDVLWVRAQGIADADLPLVFLVAATARVKTGAVVGLLKAGWTWAEIERHYRMDPQYVYYYPGPWEAYPYYDPWVGVGLWDDWGWGGWGWDGGWGGGWGGIGCEPRGAVGFGGGGVGFHR